MNLLNSRKHRFLCRSNSLPCAHGGRWGKSLIGASLGHNSWRVIISACVYNVINYVIITTADLGR